MKKTLTSHRKPSAPASLTAVRLTASSATLAWVDTCTFETGIEIQRRENGGSWFTVVALVVADSTSYVDHSMSPGVGYDYRVRAVTLTTTSPYSNLATVNTTVPIPIPLDAPTGVSATAGDASATIAWISVAGASGYKVRRSTVNGGPYTLIATVSAVAVGDSGLTNGTRYYYVVTATGSTGDSVNSAQVSAIPSAAIVPPATLAAPTGVTATPGDTIVNLAWAAVSGATSYTILRGTSAGVHGTTVTSGLAATTYQNTGLSNGTTYYYVIRAVNASTTSADSSEVHAAPIATVTVPSAPTGVSCTAGNTTNSLAWSAVTGATSYTVQRSTTSGSGYATVASGVTALTFFNTGLTNLTTYYYIVKAVNSAGTSAASTQVSGRPVSSTTTKYVATTGSDAGLGTIGDPWLTIGFGVAQLSAGDTLAIRGGTYAAQLFEIHFSATGTAWTAGHFLTVMGYPSETVTFRPTGANDNIWRFQDGSVHHLLLKDLIIDGSGVTVGAGPGSEADVYFGPLSHDIHFENVEIKDSYGNGILAEGSSHAFTNINVHGCGRESSAIYAPGHNGLYMSTTDTVITGGQFWDNKSFAIRFGSSDAGVSADRNSITGAEIYSNGAGYGLGGTSDGGSTGGGVLLSDVGNTLTNSLVYQNQTGVLLVGFAGKTSTGTKVYHNTIYHNGDRGIQVGLGGFPTPVVGAELKNNILYLNGTNLDDGGSGTVTATNLTTNPSFVDAAHADFHILTGSTAKNTGTTLAAVTTDFDGVTRPQGAAYDIGAYEFV